MKIDKKCIHIKLNLNDWKTDDYKIVCPDCNRSIFYEEIIIREQEKEWYQLQEEDLIITHEMALDACDPNLEGESL